MLFPAMQIAIVCHHLHILVHSHVLILAQMWNYLLLGAHSQTHRITATQFIMRNSCVLKAKICKKCSTTVLLPNLFDLYKSKGKRINTALLRVQSIFTQHFISSAAAEPLWGCFISHLHSRVIGLGWHLMWQTLCEDVETE